MTLKKIRYINLDAYNATSLLIDTYRFNFNVRFICNYLSKEVRRLNLFGDGTYKMISVRLRNTPSSCKLTYGTDFPDVLSILLYISEQDQITYNNTTDLTERYEFCLKLLERGYAFASQFKELPLESLLNLNDKFRENNYRNEWLWKKKLIRSYGIYVFFKCYFTTFDFRLVLEVYDKKCSTLLTKGVVLRTGPDELFYHKEFRKLEIIDDKLIIKDFLDKKNFEFDLHQLSKGIFNVEKRACEIAYFPPVDHIKLIERITW